MKHKFSQLLKIIYLTVTFILLYSIPTFSDTITEISYTDGIGIDLNSYIDLTDYINPIPSNASLLELTFSSSNNSIASINVLPDGTIRVTGHKIGSATINVSNQNFVEPIEIYVVYPRSGYEPDFDTSIWWQKNIRTTRHCYSYAFNLKNTDPRLETHEDAYWFQPGQIANILNYNNYYQRTIYEVLENNPSVFIDNIKDDIRAMLNLSLDTDVFKCLDLNDNLSTNIKDSLGINDPNNFEAVCSKDTYKVVLCVDSDGHMHWYRQDSNGLWSHKNGSDYCTQRDSNGNLIFDPRTCNKIYTDKKGNVTYNCDYIGCFEARPWQ